MNGNTAYRIGLRLLMWLAERMLRKHIREDEREELEKLRISIKVMERED